MARAKFVNLWAPPVFMSLRKSISPDQKIAIIVAGWALVLGAEAAALYLLTPPPAPPTPVAPLTVTPAATATPGAPTTAVAPAENLYTAPGVEPPPIVPAPANLPARPGTPPRPAAPPRRAADPNLPPPGTSPLGALPMGAPRSNGALPALAPPPGARTASAPIDPAAQAAFEAGAAALKRNDFAAARAQFARAVQLAPDNLPSRLNLAATYLDMNQPARAVPHLRAVTQRDPNNAAVRFTLARALLADKKLAEATPELRRVVQLAPGEREARALLAQVLFDSKKPAEAYAQWATLARDPRDVEAQVRAAALANDVLKKPAESEKWLRQAVAAAPAEPQPALMLGQLLLQKKDARGAAAVLTKAARARPAEFSLYPALADARTASGDLKGAASALQNALAHLPSGKTEAQRAQIKTTEGALRLALGRALGQSKQTKAAREQFERAATLLPRDPQPRALGALAALQMKDNAGAIGGLRAALQLDPKRAADRKLLAQVLAQTKKWGEADAQFALYDAAQPSDAPALEQWAQVAAQLKNPQKQARILTKATSADPKNPALWAQLGLAQRASGDKKAALASFNALAKLRPKDPNALYEVARLQSALGENGAAYANWKRVIEARPDVAEGYPALLEAAGRAGQNPGARQFLVRELAGQSENAVALRGILAFYERKNSPEQARAFLNDLVARDPKQKSARTALEALQKTSPSPVAPPAQAAPAPTATLKPMALSEPAPPAGPTPAAAELAAPTPAAPAQLTARAKPKSQVATLPALAAPPTELTTEPTRIARPRAKIKASRALE